MGGEEEAVRVLAAKFAAIFPHLDERQRRLLMGAEARALGHGGIRLVARAAGVREATVSVGFGSWTPGGSRWAGRGRPGGGRKRAADVDPGLRPALLALVEPEERGDPMSPLRWTVKPTRNLAGELTRHGHGRARPWVRCCAPWGSACRRTPRRSKARGTTTGTPSSVTSTTGSGRAGAPSR